MPRYVTRSSWFIPDDHLIGNSITVHEETREPVDTGLVDHTGQSIYREPDHHPLGFDTRIIRNKATKPKGSRK